MQNNLLSNQWSIAKYNANMDFLKAQAKGGMDANQIFKAKQELLGSDDYTKWEAEQVAKFGEKVLASPDFPAKREQWLNDTVAIRATNRPVAANTSGYTITPHS